jgi:hypothetical protein
MNRIKKIIEFFERDSDITLYDEWHYIHITMSELFKILLTNSFTYIKVIIKKL